jgi:hypothetical protein
MAVVETIVAPVVMGAVGMMLMIVVIMLSVVAVISNVVFVAVVVAVEITPPRRTPVDRHHPKIEGLFVL